MAALLGIDAALSIAKKLLTAGVDAAADAVVGIGREKLAQRVDDVDQQKLIRKKIEQVLQGIEMLRAKDLKAAKSFLKNAITHGHALNVQHTNVAQEDLWASYLDQALSKSIEAFGVVSSAEHKLEAFKIRIAVVVLRYRGNSSILSTEINSALEALTTDKLVQRETASELSKWFTNTRRGNLLQTIGMQYRLLLQELDPDTRQSIHELWITGRNWLGVEFSADCARLLLCGTPCTHKIKGRTSSVTCVVQLADGRVVSGSDDNTLRMWNTEIRVCEAELAGYNAMWNSVRFVMQLVDGRLMSAFDSTLLLWDLESGACVQTLTGHTNWVSCAVQLVDGRVMSGSFDNTLRIWDLESGACVQTLTGHTKWVSCVMQLADGRVMSGSFDNTLRMWDLESGVCVPTFMFHTFWVTCLVQLADGRVVSGSYDGTLLLWEMELQLWACVQKLTGHKNSVSCVMQLADGRVVSGSNVVPREDPLARLIYEAAGQRPIDSALRMWDMESGACVGALTEHTDGVRCVVQLADGRVVSGSDGKTLRMWDVAPPPTTAAVQ
jgi:WD40 repeat protein